MDTARYISGLSRLMVLVGEVPADQMAKVLTCTMEDLETAEFMASSSGVHRFIDTFGHDCLLPEFAVNMATEAIYQNSLWRRGSRKNSKRTQVVDVMTRHGVRCDKIPSPRLRIDMPLDKSGSADTRYEGAAMTQLQQEMFSFSDVIFPDMEPDVMTAMLGGGLDDDKLVKAAELLDTCLLALTSTADDRDSKSLPKGRPLVGPLSKLAEKTTCACRLAVSSRIREVASCATTILA